MNNETTIDILKQTTQITSDTIDMVGKISENIWKIKENKNIDENALSYTDSTIIDVLYSLEDISCMCDSMIDSLKDKIV